jgi:hypothetical protein
MPFVEGFDKLNSFRVRGMFGRVKAFKDHTKTAEQVMAENPLAGVYQIRHTKSGPKLLKEKLYWPNNPQTEEQQMWRGVFAEGVRAWQSLTPTQKLVYNIRARRFKFLGFNLFMREWLNSNK